MLNHRLRRWPSTKPQPVKRLVFACVVLHYSQQADWFHLTFCDTPDYVSRLLPLFRFAAFWWDRPSNKRERHCACVGLMLGCRRRRRPNIKPTQIQRLAFSPEFVSVFFHLSFSRLV